MNPVVSLERSLPDMYIPHRELPEIENEEALRATVELIVPALMEFSALAPGKLRKTQTKESSRKTETNTAFSGHRQEIVNEEFRRKVLQEINNIPVIFKP